MVEEIVTATAKSKTDKTVQNEAETLRIGEETETYVSDAKTRQALLNLLTAKINSQTASSSKPKVNVSQMGLPLLILLVLLVMFLITNQNPDKQNEVGKRV